ncbi:MAG: hypothetical protein ACJ8AO_20180 [Gemmatimonadaceae bacterium]
MTSERKDRADERDPRETPAARGDNPSLGGRSFGGASFGSSEREQTADHGHHGEDYRVDDAVNPGEETRERSRDES